MSGPTTAMLIEDPIAVLLSAAGIRAAMAIRQGYQESAELAAKHQADRSNLLQQQQQAAMQGRHSLQQQLEQAQTEFHQLLTLARRLGVDERIQAGQPVADAADEDSSHYLQALRGYNAEIKSILLTSAATHADQWHDATDTLPEFGTAIANATPTSDVQRLMARIAHLDSIPDPISALVAQLAEPLPKEREELLTNELRRHIQLYLEDVQRRQVQEASALILRQSLKDLGYQVQEFSDTLFVEGGVLHFQRHGWGDYMVRLRINEKTHTANFNVVRAVQDASNERSVADHLAEDRWCAEFPALLKAMEARGLGLSVTRRLEAGELPVQQVNADQLPTFAETGVEVDAQEKRRYADQPLQAREIG